MSRLKQCLQGGEIDKKGWSGPLYRAAVVDGDYACTTTLTLAMDLATFKKVMTHDRGILFSAEVENKMQTAKFLKGKEIVYTKTIE